MDILYYSNYCSNSQKVIQYITKSGLIDKINCICIDKRVTNPNTGQIQIQLENGKKVLMPPNVQHVPALLIVAKKYSAIFGGEIISYFEPYVKGKTEEAMSFNGEPVGISLGQPSGSNISSEHFTFYNMTPDELSAKGKGGMRQMYNYVSAEHSNYSIQTPIDTYRPDKVGEGVSIESLEKQRNQDVPLVEPTNPYGFS
jgi:hypothetical protein